MRGPGEEAGGAEAEEPSGVDDEPLVDEGR